MYCVDLPGYGFAKVSKQTQEKWGRMIENYLHKSKVLKAVFLLIDIRHEPSANDVNMYQWILANGYSPIIIATKLDKIKRSQLQKNIKIIRQKLECEPGTVIIPFSAETSPEVGPEVTYVFRCVGLLDAPKREYKPLTIKTEWLTGEDDEVDMR